MEESRLRGLWNCILVVLWIASEGLLGIFTEDFGGFRGSGGPLGEVWGPLVEVLGTLGGILGVLSPQNPPRIPERPPQETPNTHQEAP